MSYNNYLVEGSEEQKKTLEAIAKLEKIAQSVNESMGLPSNEELFKLYDRFQCNFDVFYPGRRLIRQGEVLKQTRKEPQPRYLVLFSDTLWVCRVMSGFASSGLFDMGRSYRIPIETVRTESNPHEDYEQQLYVKSKYKSLILIMSSARERTLWQKDIDTAREEKRKYKRRMSEAIERQRRQSLNPLMLEAPLTEVTGAEDTLTDTNATIVDESGQSTNGDILHNLPPLMT
ncbi:PH domain protein, partial [Teladorsagia circumcincta]